MVVNDAACDPGLGTMCGEISLRFEDPGGPHQVALVEVAESAATLFGRLHTPIRARSHHAVIGSSGQVMCRMCDTTCTA